MTAATCRWAADLLRVWFHDLRPADWWSGGNAVDAMLRRRFARPLAMLARRPAAEFLSDSLTARAAILLFDQVPRNICRGTPAAFATDPLARTITSGVLRRRWDQHLPRQERQFVYMPLMHSEAIADQRLSLAMFALHVPAALGFARSHHRMIARFGRFPHRNPVLGRTSSPAERRAVADGFAW